MDKHELIDLLRTGGYVSGAEIGRTFGISRAAVSKAVAALKKEGYGIESVPNRGHRLVSEPDLLTADLIRANLPGHPWKDLVTVLPTVDSTNNALKLLAAQGAPEGTVLLADCQTGGRGRMGRSFDSAAGKGIYLSLLLRPACAPSGLMTLTAQAAVAVRRAVGEVCGTAPEIKWVNDLFLNGKKICGILTELSLEAETGLVSHAVVGIGVNCNRPAEDFPEALRPIAGSVLSQTGKAVDRNALAAAMIRQLTALPRLDWRAEYTAACMNLGRAVTILAPGRPPEAAFALAVGENAELIVRTEAGEERAVNSGEVSLRLPTRLAQEP